MQNVLTRRDRTLARAQKGSRAMANCFAKVINQTIFFLHCTLTQSLTLTITWSNSHYQHFYLILSPLWENEFRLFYFIRLYLILDNSNTKL